MLFYVPVISGEMITDLKNFLMMSIDIVKASYIVSNKSR